MSQIFISYRSSDLESVRALRDGLHHAGLAVWWDRNLEGGEAWRIRLETELGSAACVIVVWSDASVGEGGEFVKDEARRAQKRGVLLPVRIDAVEPPLGFGEYQVLDLVGWTGNVNDDRFRDVLAASRALIAGGPRPVPVWPARGRRRRVLWASSGLLGMGVVGLIALQPSWICSPRIWNLLEPIGLVRCPSRCFDWRPHTERLQQTVRPSFEPMPNEQQAKNDALARGHVEANEVTCAPSPSRRLLHARSEVSTWQCSQLLDGSRCGYDGLAVCEMNRLVDRCSAAR